MKVKLAPIGNFRGVRIPQAFIRACGFEDQVDMRIEKSAIVLAAPRHPRRNWDAAFEKMAAAGDDALLLPDRAASGRDDTEWEW